MKRRKKDLSWAEHSEIMERSYSALLAEYSGNVITIPECDKWDHVLPEMYISYRDGFIFPRCEAHRAMPLFAVSGNTLYLRHTVNHFRLAPNELEKYLCFDRHNNKYTVVIVKSTGHAEQGNPSYFRFLPRVQTYISKAERLQIRKEQQP